MKLLNCNLRSPSNDDSVPKLLPALYIIVGVLEQPTHCITTNKLDILYFYPQLFGNEYSLYSYLPHLYSKSSEEYIRRKHRIFKKYVFKKQLITNKRNADQ